MKKYLNDERLTNLVKFVIEDQIIASLEFNNDNYGELVTKLKARKHSVDRIIDWVRNHEEHIKNDTTNVCNPKYYTMIVDAIVVEIADFKDDDPGTVAFDFEKQYSKDNWDR